MTRKSRRELERAVETLTDDPDDGLPDGYRLFVWENAETGEWYPGWTAALEGDGDSLDKSEITPATVYITGGTEA